MRRSIPYALSLLLLPEVLAAQAERYPFPQHATYAAGTLVPNHRSQTQLDTDVREAYARWQAAYLTAAGTEPDGHPRYRVKLGTGANAATVSEGQGYGMIVVAHLAGWDMAARTIFDGLWEFALDHPSTIDARLMDWHVEADEVPDGSGNDSAFDGDADLAYALLLAEQQWGNGGRFHYGNEARRVLAGLAASTVGPTSRLPLLGDWVDPGGSPYNERTVRPSDFLAGHFRTFARFLGTATWHQVAAAVAQATERLQTEVSPQTGLLPDFVVPLSAGDPAPRPAPPGFLEGPNDGQYFYNAGRVPWRLATDAVLNGDVVARTQARRLAAWIRSATGGIPTAIKPGYQLDGTPIPPGDFFTSFFAAPFAVAALTDPSGQSFLNAVYDAVRTRQEGYYEDSVTLLCLLVLSHNFWDPSRPPGLFSDGFDSGGTERWSLVVGG